MSDANVSTFEVTDNRKSLVSSEQVSVERCVWTVFFECAHVLGSARFGDIRKVRLFRWSSIQQIFPYLYSFCFLKK